MNQTFSPLRSRSTSDCRYCFFLPFGFIELLFAALLPFTPLDLSAQDDKLSPDSTSASTDQAGAAAAAEESLASRAQRSSRPGVESEVIFEGLGSFGHFHIFANSWWSEVYLGGVEYDRHSWGEFLKARMDYVAELQPVAILKQPSNTDVWGNPVGTGRALVPGLGIAPIGLRMIWRSNQALKPYFIIKGGLIGFTQKALSRDASYANMSLQVGLGIQFHLKDRMDMRVGFSDFHFSDAFVVPSNPGLDSMSLTAGLSYHLGKHTRSR